MLFILDAFFGIFEIFDIREHHMPALASLVILLTPAKLGFTKTREDYIPKIILLYNLIQKNM